MFQSFFKYLLSLLLFFTFIGCSKAPITNRNQIITTDKSKELALGKKMSNRILRRTTISKNKKAIDIVNEVGMKIVKVVNQDYNTTNYEWKITVLDDKFKASAVCLPGGRVFIYSGLFPYLDNKDELAVVLGHEIAHALARHKVERKASSIMSNFSASIIKILIDEDKSILKIQKDREKNRADEMMKEWVVLPYSRTHEYEADHIGLILSTKAGYNPKAFLSFWRKFPQESIVKPEYSSTHPTPVNRMKKIEALMPSLMLLYNKDSKEHF